MENQMRSRDAGIVPIGNSKGVRIPKALLQKYGLKNSILIEETDKGLLLCSKEDCKHSKCQPYREVGTESHGS